jgi:hypothetical protein
MSGESVSLNDLRNALSGGNAPDDYSFTDGNLSTVDGSRMLFVPSVLPGGITVVDNNGYVVMADQVEHRESRVVDGACVVSVDGVNVILDGFLVDGMLPGTWWIRYNRGMTGHDNLSASVSDATSEELMLYTIIFG